MNPSFLNVMHKYFILLFLFFSSALNAQQRHEKKLTKLWSKDQEKCIQKAKHFIEKQKALPTSYYYLTLFYVEQAEKQTKYRYLKKALKVYREAIDYPSQNLPGLGIKLDSIINQWARGANHGNLTKVANLYLEVFHDSLKPFQELLSNHKRQLAIEKNLETLINLDSLRRSLLSYALELEGVPYKWAGEDPSGFDCSGFTKYVYSKIGIELPHNAQLQALNNIGIEQPFEDAKPGDLVFFGTKNENSIHVVHAAILLENHTDSTKVIHCVSNGVRVDGDNTSWEHHWKDKILFSRQVLSTE